MLLLNASVGFIQEYQAGSIVHELKKTLALKAVVLRDGRLSEVEAPEVVPGDILQIEEVRNGILHARGRRLTITPFRVQSFLPMVALSPMTHFSKLINLQSPESLSQSTSTREINATRHLALSEVKPSSSLQLLGIALLLVVPLLL